MSRVDPRVKLLWVVLCTSGAVLFARPLWMLGRTLFTLGGALLLGADFLGLGRRLRRFLPVLAMLTAVQILFVRTGTPLLTLGGRVLVTGEGLWKGLAAGLRLVIVFCASAVMMREDSRRVINSLIQMGVPYLFCFSLFAALCFLPLLSEAFAQALTALQLRGVNLKAVPWGQKLRLYAALIVPVLTEALARVEKLAAVMEARGFGALPRRTIYGRASMGAADWAAVCFLLVAGLTALRFYLAS